MHISVQGVTSLWALLPVLCLTNLFSQCNPGPAPPEYPIVILISIDGFRADYLDRKNTPNLYRLAQDGVKADYLEPVFPTSTFPTRLHDYYRTNTRKIMVLSATRCMIPSSTEPLLHVTVLLYKTLSGGRVNPSG